MTKRIKDSLKIPFSLHKLAHTIECTWLDLNALQYMGSKVIFNAPKYFIYIPRIFHHSKTSGEAAFNILAIENKNLVIASKLKIKLCRFEN